MRSVQRLLTSTRCSSRLIIPYSFAQSSCRNASYIDPRRISRTDPAQLEKLSRQEPRLAQFTIDEQIQTAFVQVKNSESNKLGEPQSLHLLLSDINRSTHVVNQLGKPAGREFAIVEVAEKEDLKRRVKAREDAVIETQKATRARKPKQIELNWAIGDNDLQLKLKQLQQFIEKGRKVEILLAARRHARKATPEEGERVMETLREKVSDLGAKEVKPMEGKILGQATMVVSKTGN